MHIKYYAQSRPIFGFFQLFIGLVSIWFAMEIGYNLEVRHVASGWNFLFAMIAVLIIFSFGVYCASAAMTIWKFSAWQRLVGYIILFLALKPLGMISVITIGPVFY